jgi:hypothetical protein
VGQGPVRRRVFVEDSRRDGTFLRVTWHPDGGQFVVSTWHDEVCTGAVRVPAEDAAPLIGLLADGLADAATRPAAPPAPARHRGWATSVLARVGALLRRIGRPTPAPAGATSLRAVDDAA